MLYNRSKIFFISVLIFSCSSEPEIYPDNVTADGMAPYDEEFIPHPIPRFMPHSDVDAIELELRDAADILDSLPENLQLLYRFLNDESQVFNEKELSLIVSNSDEIGVASLDETSLLFLDKYDNRFFQYDLLEDKYVSLAPQGRGPGDIFFTQEMQVYNKRAYVAMEGFRISVFDCQLGKCMYESTISTEWSGNYSIAPLGDKLMALGRPGFSSDLSVDSEGIEHTIYQLNSDGEVVQSFGQPYQYWHPVVGRAIHSYSTVRSFPKYEFHAVVFNFFPYIYLYNFEGELAGKYRVPGYLQGYYDLKEGPGNRYMGRYRHNDNSGLSATIAIDDQWLLIQKKERRDMQWELGRAEGSEWSSYYLFNVGSHELYDLGTDSIREINSARAISVVDNGLVVNEQGTLYWVGSERLIE
ncbi:MAG: hypothetical protein ACNA78_08295 [Balneolaceae bacterium]